MFDDEVERDLSMGIALVLRAVGANACGDGFCGAEDCVTCMGESALDHYSQCANCEETYQGCGCGNFERDE